MKTFRAEGMKRGEWKRLKRAKAELEAETNRELLDKLLQEAGFDDDD